MITRAKSRHLPPPRKLSLIFIAMQKEPTSVTEALGDPQWFKVMEDEYEALIKNDTWELVIGQYSSCYWS